MVAWARQGQRKQKCFEIPLIKAKFFLHGKCVKKGHDIRHLRFIKDSC